MTSSRKKITFMGHSHELSGILSKPKDKAIANILYAHCFTCGKDFTASSRICKSLVKLGFNVFRFDFTGIGASKGQFSDSNFSSNVMDYVCAANYMKKNNMAADLLVGHSLGGTTAIKAADQIPDAKAVVCISSPAHASHITHLFSDEDMAKINSKSSTVVNLAGREFLIKKQFLDDLKNQKTGHIKKLNKALLVMHSPIDRVVNIKEAEKIYVKAKHPKSFISLDDTDHLLSNRDDTQYAAEIIATWVQKFIH